MKNGDAAAMMKKAIRASGPDRVTKLGATWLDTASNGSTVNRCFVFLRCHQPNVNAMLIDYISFTGSSWRLAATPSGIRTLRLQLTHAIKHRAENEAGSNPS
jgi:hypothetical protein